MKLHCATSTTLTSGDALWSDWSGLLGRARPELQIFRPEWYTIWNETLGSCGRWTGALQILEARDALGVLRGVLPLGTQKLGFAKVRSLAGDWQPWRTLIADAAFEREVGFALGEYLADSDIAAVRLGPAPRSAAATDGLVDALTQRCGFVERSRTAQLAVCNAPGTWEEYKKEYLNNKFLSSLRRYEKKVKQAGVMTIDHVRQPTADETARIIDDLGRIERHSWLATKDKGHMRFACDPGRTFWQRLIDSSLSPNDQVDCWIMRLDGQPVSFCFTLTSGPARYVVANQYDETVKKFGTGKTLYRHMMKDGINRGIRRFDFGDNELHYKKDWGASYQDCLDSYIAIPNRVLGRCMRKAWSFRQWLQSSHSNCHHTSNDDVQSPDHQSNRNVSTVAFSTDDERQHASANAASGALCHASSSHESMKE
jgi:CelD/BcsL family acetyltransferase involved in cellulose biosynthesis